MTDGVGQEAYTYNLLGQTTQMQKKIDSSTYPFTYTYNLAGELASITYPSGRVVQETFDAVGRLSKLADATTTYIKNMTYNAAQQATGFLYGNGLCASFGFSSDRTQLTGLSYFTPSTSGNCQSTPSQTLLGLNYYYKVDSNFCPGGTSGNNGQIQCITDSVDSGRTEAFAYDSIGRMSAAVSNGSTTYPQWGLSFSYDRYGNRTAQSVTKGMAPSNSIAVNAATNRITTGGYAYDLSGNMTNDGNNSLVYNAENRVTSSTGGLGAGAYIYDGSGLRVKKCLPNCSSPSSTTVYVFSGGKVTAEYVNGAALGSPTREYIYAGGALLAKIEAGATQYYHADHLSTRMMTNSSGSSIGQQGNYPYGELWYPSGGAVTKWQFTSYERDTESGDDYAMARIYVNRLGRFSAADPQGGSTLDPQTLNRYAYGGNDPVNHSDPSGMMTINFAPFILGFGGGLDGECTEDGVDAFCGSLGGIISSGGGSVTINPGNFNAALIFGNLPTLNIQDEFGFLIGDTNPPESSSYLRSAALLLLSSPGTNRWKDALRQILKNKACAGLFGGTDKADAIVDQMSGPSDVSPGSGFIAHSFNEMSLSVDINKGNALAGHISAVPWNGGSWEVLVGEMFNTQPSMSGQLSIILHEMLEVATAPDSGFVDTELGRVTAAWFHNLCGTDLPTGMGEIPTTPAPLQTSLE
jgi:RHS repeat-associated protein